jgi:hypothetical protein
MRSTWGLWAVVGVVCGVVAAPAMGQGTLRPPGAQWSVKLPAGWKQAPQSAEDQLNKARDEEDPDREEFRYVLQFDRQTGLGVGYPYMSVGYTRYEEFKTASWEDIVEFLGATEVDPAAGSKPLIENIGRGAAETYALDRSRNRWSYKYDAPGRADSGRTLRTIGVGWFANHGLVEVCLYDKAEETDRYVGDLEKLAAGFALDPGPGFVPWPGLPKEPVRTTRSPTGGSFRFRYGFFGFEGLGGAALLFFIIRRAMDATD